VDAHAILREFEANRWHPITARVIKLDIAPITRRQELIAAVLHHGNLHLTGVAALEFLGLEMNQDQRIDLIGPRGTRVEPFPHVVIHTSRREFSAATGFPQRTCHDLSVVYAMAWAKTLKQARHFAYWSIQNGFVTIESLCNTVFSNRRSSLMKAAIPRVLSLRDQVDTVNEHLFVSLCKKYEIGDLIFKPEFLLDDGTPIHADFGIRRHGQLLAVEIDGVQHELSEARTIDAYRMRTFKRHGSETFRISNRELKESPDAVMKALKFRLRGL
jgi:very-short-patch-repair endonuclease